MPFDASVFVGYTRLKAETQFNDDLSFSTLSGTNQAGSYEVKSLVLQIIVSRKLSILTIYGGFGFSRTISSLKMTGTCIVAGETDITSQDESVRQLVLHLKYPKILLASMLTVPDL